MQLPYSPLGMHICCHESFLWVVDLASVIGSTTHSQRLDSAWKQTQKLCVACTGVALRTQACSTAGMYGQAFATRLQHVCDAVLELEAVSDESDVVQLIPDPARYSEPREINCSLTVVKSTCQLVHHQI